MRGVNRDTVIAIILLLFCGVGYYQTLQIRKTSYGSMGSEVWPQAILAILAVLTLIYLAQSVRSTTGVRLGGGDGLRGFEKAGAAEQKKDDRDDRVTVDATHRLSPAVRI